MFKNNYDFYEITRRVRRLFDGKLTYRKLLVVLIFSCLFFLWLLSRFFGSNNKAGPKGMKSRGLLMVGELLMLRLFTSRRAEHMYR